jgi:SAM-dependent methyltransferase
LCFADETFDLVFGHSILHHTDLTITRGQLHRVLRTGGRAVFVEPLGHNPLINLFRRLTPTRRTPSETPLRFEDVSFLAGSFSRSSHREFHLAALAAFALVPCGSRRLFRAALGALGRVDRALLRSESGLGRFAWATVVELIK